MMLLISNLTAKEEFYHVPEMLLRMFTVLGRYHSYGELPNPKDWPLKIDVAWLPGPGCMDKSNDVEKLVGYSDPGCLSGLSI